MVGLGAEAVPGVLGVPCGAWARVLLWPESGHVQSGCCVSERGPSLRVLPTHSLAASLLPGGAHAPAAGWAPGLDVLRGHQGPKAASAQVRRVVLAGRRQAEVQPPPGWDGAGTGTSSATLARVLPG